MGHHFGVHAKISDSTHTDCSASIYILYNKSSTRFPDTLLIVSNLQILQTLERHSKWKLEKKEC